MHTYNIVLKFVAAYSSNFWIKFLITSWSHGQIIMGNGASPRLGGGKTEEVAPDWFRFDVMLLLQRKDSLCLVL